MKKLKTVLLWILSIFMLLLGIVGLLMSFTVGLLWIVSAIVCNPIFLSKTKFTWKISVPLFIVLFFAGFYVLPSDSDAVAETVPIETVAETSTESISQTESETTKETAPETAELNVHFLDVGQGLGVLIESDGHYMLYDGGDSDKSSFVVSYLKDQGVESLDYLVTSHYDSDHLNGALGALHAFDVDTVIGPDYEHDSNLYESFINTVSEKGKEVTHPSVGDEFSLGSSKFTILSPASISSDSNNNSVAIKIVNGGNSFILTGDAESDSEESMCNSGIDLSCDVLCVGHHGSASSTSWSLLQASVPEYAVISCGNDNQYGHPDKDTMDKLQDMEISVYRTDKQGTIVVHSDGENLSFNQEPCNNYAPGDDQDSGTIPQNEAQPVVSEEVPVVEPEVNDDLVWIPASGSKYHRIPDCGKMNPNTAYQMSRSDAQASGYDACKKCY